MTQNVPQTTHVLSHAHLKIVFCVLFGCHRVLLARTNTSSVNNCAYDKNTNALNVLEKEFTLAHDGRSKEHRKKVMFTKNR